MWDLTVTAEQRSKLILRRTSHYLLRGHCLRRVHAHIQGPREPVTETTLSGIKLVPGNAEIEQHAVDGTKARLGDCLSESRKRRAEQAHPITVRSQAFVGGFDGLWIAIDGDEPRSGAEPIQERRRMSTTADGRIDVDALGKPRERRHDALAQDRHMVDGGHGVPLQDEIAQVLAPEVDLGHLIVIVLGVPQLEAIDRAHDLDPVLNADRFEQLL